MPLPGRFEGTHTLGIPHGGGSMSFGSSLMSIAILSQVFLCRFMHTSGACAAGHNGLCG